MDHTMVTLAWAVEVEPRTLGARLQAYGDCKAGLTTFLLCCDDRKLQDCNVGLQFFTAR